MSQPEDQRTINDWAQETFGNTTVLNALYRMNREYCELQDAIDALVDSNSSYSSSYAAEKRSKAQDECADVLITLYRVAEMLGCDLHAMVNEKMAVNRARKWVVDKATGTGQHVK